MFETDVEKIATLILCSKLFFNVPFFLEKVEKYCRAGQDVDDNMAYAHCMLDT